MRFLALILCVALLGCESSAVTPRTINPSPMPTTYATVSWLTRSNGILVSDFPSVLSASEDLKTWNRLATNTGEARIASDAPQLFFKVEPL